MLMTVENLILAVADYCVDAAMQREPLSRGREERNLTDSALVGHYLCSGGERTERIHSPE